MSVSTLPEITGTEPAVSQVAALRAVTSRLQAAAGVAFLADLADDLASEILAAGPGDPADEGTERDPIAWKEIAAHLNRMSLALSGGILHVEDSWDDEDMHEWKDLAQATTRREFAAAWAAIKDELIKRATAEDGEKPPLREFAVTRILTVAAAVIDGSW